MALALSLLWLALALHLCPSPVQSCDKGSARQCAEADFAPGSNLAGEGFDVSKMERKGAFVIDMKRWRKDKSCTLCANPYLEQKKQKLPLSVVDWRAIHKCSVKVSSSVYRSSEALLSASTNSIENNWSASLGIDHPKGGGSLMLAGTNSKLAEYSMEKTKKDKFSFTTHSFSCEFYSYRVSNKPFLHPEFKAALKQLPKVYDLQFKARFYKLIDTFGTHYITKVTLGGRVNSVTSIKECQASLQGLNVDEVKTCLDVEASASVMGKVNMKAETKHCDEAKTKTDSKTSFASSFSDRLTEIFGGHTTEPELLFSADKDPGAYKQWLESLPLHPDVILYSLEPLHELLPTNSPSRKHLRKAVHDYILERSLWRNCSEPCRTGIKHNPQEPCVCTCKNNPGVTPSCCPSKRGLARVKITVIRATGLWGDTIGATDAYVKVYNKDLQIGRTPVIWNNNSPKWDMTFDQGDVVLTDYSSVRLEVWDEDNKWDDDLLGTCGITIETGTKENFCANLNSGELYYKTEVQCAPSLAGSSCTDYVASPMNFKLEKTYVSRHALPVPKEMLVGMGVIVGDPQLTFKQIRHNTSQPIL